MAHLNEFYYTKNRDDNEFSEKCVPHKDPEFNVKINIDLTASELSFLIRTINDMGIYVE